MTSVNSGYDTDTESVLSTSGGTPTLMSLPLNPPQQIFDESQDSLKFTSFAITFRPLGGISEKDLSDFMTWTKRSCQFYKVITEKTGHERHIHAAIIARTQVTRGNMVKSLLRKYPHLSFDEKKVFRQGIKIMTSNKWLDYLEKGDETIVIEDNLPERGHIESYFKPLPPPKQTGPSSEAKDKWFSHLETLWYEHMPPGSHSTPPYVRHFLYDMMYNKRLIKVIRDDKSIVQTSRHLSRYIQKQTTCDIMFNTQFENDS